MGSRERRRRGFRPRVALLLLLGAAACVTTLSSRSFRPFHRTAPVDGATELVGADECETCHEDVHGFAPAPSYHSDCEACHGSGELHIDSEEVSEIRFPANEDCVACHGQGERTLLGWSLADHNRGGVLCSDCHATHDRELKHVRAPEGTSSALLVHASDVTRMCSDCHSDVAASLDLPSHHPLREGMLDCTDCHSPHASQRTRLGVATRQCTVCHQDYAGPWIYDHPPVTEDCGHCHAPHGTSSPALLATSQPGVCISCHTVAESGAVHDPTAFSTRCSDCHSAIHGSYADPHLRR